MRLKPFAVIVFAQFREEFEYVLHWLLAVGLVF